MSQNSHIESVKGEHQSKLIQPKPNGWPGVYRAIIYIHANLFNKKLTVGSTKKECRICDKSFATKFKHSTGYTPKAYIQYHRIETSKQLLQQTEESISIIAISVGFRTLSSFDKAFEKAMDQKPSTWRANHPIDK